MKRILIAGGLAVLCGCNGNLGFQLGSVGKSATQPSVGPGSGFSSSSVNMRFGDAPGLGSMLGAIGLGWLVGRDARGDTRLPPAMDANRAINEQDCSQAPVDSSANLRCR
jgi:hypothetical protein